MPCVYISQPQRQIIDTSNLVGIASIQLPLIPIKDQIKISLIPPVNNTPPPPYPPLDTTTMRSPTLLLLLPTLASARDWSIKLTFLNRDLTPSTFTWSKHGYTNSQCYRIPHAGLRVAGYTYVDNAWTDTIAFYQDETCSGPTYPRTGGSSSDSFPWGMTWSSVKIY